MAKQKSEEISSACLMCRADGCDIISGWANVAIIGKRAKLISYFVIAVLLMGHKVREKFIIGNLNKSHLQES